VLRANLRGPTGADGTPAQGEREPGGVPR